MVSLGISEPLLALQLRAVQTFGTTGEMVPAAQHELGLLLDLVMWACPETLPRCTCLTPGVEAHLLVGTDLSFVLTF